MNKLKSKIDIDEDFEYPDNMPGFWGRLFRDLVLALIVAILIVSLVIVFFVPCYGCN